MNHVSLIIFAVTILQVSLPAEEKSAHDPRPNIVFFLVDDLGISDLACYGSRFHESPHIDQLAKDGIQYLNAYSSHPVCGPARSAIMTGKFPARLNLVGIGGGINPGETIWPKRLKEQGYTTYFTGKWHMGNEQSVLQNGFDYNVAGNHNGQPGDFYYPYKAIKGNKRLERQDVIGMEDGKEGDYLTDALTDKALNFLDSHDHQKSPFLLYFSYYNVHKPFVSNAQGRKQDLPYFTDKLRKLQNQGTRETSEYDSFKVDEKLTQDNVDFASQIKAVDDSVGRIIDKLKSLGLEKNTIVIFTSDQGSMNTSKIAVSSARPYRFGKAFNYEGGIRVPLIIKWPQGIKQEGQNTSVTISTDLYPTLMDAVKLPKDAKQHVDGQSIISTFKGQDIAFNRSYYWCYPTNHSLGHKGSVAVRKGPYKLIYWPKTQMSRLYNVDKDISESHDLSQSKPEIHERMFKELKSWQPIKKHLTSTK